MNTTSRPTRQAPLNGLTQQNAIVPADQQQGLGQARNAITAPSATVMKAYPPKIAKAILRIARQIQPVEKAGINDFHSYAYPKWEDIRDALWPMVNETGLIIIQDEITKEGLTTDMIALTYEFTIINEDGDVWPDKPKVTAICKIRDAKGVLDDKAASKCRTQAEKNACVQIFKIRTEDVYEVDNEGKVRRNSPRRAAPNPEGQFQPHELPILKDEPAENWAKRFKEKLVHAKSAEDVDEWYSANARIFNRLESVEAYKAIHEGLVDAMDERVLAVTGGQPAIEKKPDSGFPGDKQLKPADAGDIPPALRRTAPPPDQPKVDRAWLDKLEAEFAACETPDDLVSVQDSVMMPAQDTTNDATWAEAVAITKKHFQRVSQNDA